ncbi:cytochrome P450 [Embleya sp. NBC_00888]|uniref:cytochrome P450 n=1 Tax=Embleya sp. NBC_00888 TaxID=2975960 RepID=UPI00387006F1|nr:cytochrome P450 [Embleya sp. NBC_00888]
MTDTTRTQTPTPAPTPASVPEAPATVDERSRQWSLYQPWLQQDPIPYWKQMRASAPIVRSEEAGGFWILTRYEDIEWAARSPELFSNAELVIPHRQIFPTKQIPIQLDGEEHRKWRLTLASLFNPGVVNHFAPRIREAAVDAIEPIVAAGRCEFLTDFGIQLPAETFLISFGIGREHLRTLLDHKTWLRREGIPNARTDEDLRVANKPLWDFFGEAVDQRRAEGTQGRRDVISQLVEGRFDGRELTRDEMINAAFVTMLASLDSTTAQLGLIFLYLARHPEIQDLINANPDRIPAVVEELIRHEPVSSTGRLVTRDVERHGVTMRKGDRVLLSWGMSGLDPDAFENPDEVDFDRNATRQLAFGTGPHRCLGMHLARRIIGIAVEEWHKRVPNYHVAEGTVPLHHYSPGRGLHNLDLVLGRARG